MGCRNWSLTTNTTVAFKFSENVASTASGSTLLAIQTIATSPLLPLVVTAQGTANGVEVDTTGNLQAIASVTVTLVNKIGNSTAVTVNLN